MEPDAEGRSRRDGLVRRSRSRTGDEPGRRDGHLSAVPQVQPLLHLPAQRLPAGGGKRNDVVLPGVPKRVLRRKGGVLIHRRVRESAVLLALILSGCAGNGATRFVHPEYNFGFVEKVAVVPLENLSQDQGAGARATRILVNELLAVRAFAVTEPGEVSQQLGRLGTLRAGELPKEQIGALGEALGVQALILGSVGESGTSRTAGRATNTVTLVLRMVDIETGTTVWSATVTEDGRGFWSRVLGTGEASLSEVTRDAIRKAIGTLIE
ncbi:MAG: hypothetical protein GF328_03440 [Candidatus Latescibacteria bacterium]|nr:hypothetical protein [Candidatus Latescibacterota bacterium]